MRKKIILINYKFDVSCSDDVIEKSFLFQVQKLMGWDYLPLSTNILKHKLQITEDIDDKYFVLLFDSKQMKYLHLIEDILKLYSIPYTCFLNPDKIDKEDSHNLLRLLKYKQNANLSYGYELVNQITNKMLIKSKNKLEKLLDTELNIAVSNGEFNNGDIFSMNFSNNLKKSKMINNCINLKTTSIQTGEKSFNFWYNVYKSEISQIKM